MAKRVADLPGFGSKTVKDLRRSVNRSDLSLGTELTVDEIMPIGSVAEGSMLDVKLNKRQKKELAKETGRKIGDQLPPNRNRGIGSSKIPDGFKRTGDFLYEKGQRQEAGRMFNDLPESRQEDDRNERARVTTDLEEWEDNKSGLDFPGIDTPTRKPGRKTKTLDSPSTTSEPAAFTITVC